MLISTLKPSVLCFWFCSLVSQKSTGITCTWKSKAFSLSLKMLVEQIYSTWDGRSAVDTNTKSWLCVQQLYHCLSFLSHCFPRTSWKRPWAPGTLASAVTCRRWQAKLEAEHSGCEEGLCSAIPCSLCRLHALMYESPPRRGSQATTFLALWIHVPILCRPWLYLFLIKAVGLHCFCVNFWS